MDSRPSFSRWRLRLAGAAMTAFAVAVFVMALRLQPDPRGYGTHEQLGLPACQFYSLTGVLCPHCGTTTSFAHTVRGQFPQAMRANPCGPLLVLVLAAVVLPWSLGAAVCGRSLVVDSPVWWLLVIGSAYLSVAAIAWVSRMIIPSSFP